MADSSATPERKTGTVDRVLGEFGFVRASDMPGEDIYFKASWFQGTPPLQRGEGVTFQLKTFADKPQAHYLRRVGAAPQPSDPPPGKSGCSPTDRRPTSPRILNWAYLGYLPNVLIDLKGMALKEDWEFKNKPLDPERPLPILYSYLLHTFGRLVFEKKVLVNENASLAAFNTGLVDRRYEPIYAMFGPNHDPRAPWRLMGFCVAGEGPQGQNLVRYFNPLPPPAHYFDSHSVLLYDVRAGKPEVSWQHIIIENIDRFPREFLEDYCPPGFALQDTALFGPEQRKEYFEALGKAVESHDRTYRAFINRLKDALDLSIKRVAWNFKTAIPQYYPRVKSLTLLLPICLVSDERVDFALAVEKTVSGNYLGHTILSLDWAYRNARLICRPDSDWLVPKEIVEVGEEEPEE